MAMNTQQYMTLALCIGIPVLVGAVSGIATAQSVTTWYAGLKKPSFNPPSSIFGPVWTLLYILMGVSLYLIWIAPGSPQRTAALAAFALQLVLNAAWSFLFFQFRQITLAFWEIVLLWFSILWMIILFMRVSQTAALIQFPYLIWVAFATILNGAIRIKNLKGDG